MIQIEPIGNAPKPLYPSSIILQDAPPIGQTRRYRQPQARRRQLVRRRPTTTVRYIPGRGRAVVTRRGGQTTIVPLAPEWTPARGGTAAVQRAQAQIRREVEARRLRSQAQFRREYEQRQAAKRRAGISTARRPPTWARQRQARLTAHIRRQTAARQARQRGLR